MNLIFQDTISPAALYRSDSAATTRDGSTLIVTHILDGDIFSLVEESLVQGSSIILVFNQAGYTAEEKEQADNYFQNLRERGARILVVDSSDTIVTDLET